jgi:hypothetical protein
MLSFFPSSVFTAGTRLLTSLLKVLITHTVQCQRKKKGKKKKREGKRGKEEKRRRKRGEQREQSIKEKCTFQQNFSKFSPPAELPAGGGREAEFHFVEL